jgi:hypothetical protein
MRPYEELQGPTLRLLDPGLGLRGTATSGLLLKVEDLGERPDSLYTEPSWWRAQASPLRSPSSADACMAACTGRTMNGDHAAVSGLLMCSGDGVQFLDPPGERLDITRRE